MDNQYMTGQFILQAEQEHDFLKTSTRYALEITQILKSHDLQQYKALSSSPFMDTLSPYITENFEVMKLYVAVHAADCIRTVCQSGLPANITENLKKMAFSQIAEAKTQKDLGDLMDLLLQKLADAYKKYAVGSYSYNVQRAIEYMQTQRFQPLSPGSVAEYLKVERTNLSKRFHKETGMTMTDYIHTMKMDLAEELIHGRNYSLMEVCDLLGYGNYNYFCKLYKKYKHRLPSQG